MAPTLNSGRTIQNTVPERGELRRGTREPRFDFHALAVFGQPQALHLADGGAEKTDLRVVFLQAAGVLKIERDHGPVAM